MKRILSTLPAFFMIMSAAAQEAAVPAAAATSPISPAASGSWELDSMTVALILLAVIILMASKAMLHAFQVISKELANPSPYSTPEKAIPVDYEEWAALKKSKPGIWIKLLGLRPIEEEKDIMMEHQFDGITELDNPTPAWFMVLFYGTIAFAFGYMMYFHVLNIGPLQDEEYAIEMQAAEQEKKIRLANSANNIDESSVKVDLSPAIISAGKALYSANCIACHGDAGQGTVGPNLTDEYWLHGGEVGDVFKTIKYGVPAKGMISWEKTLNPKQISEVSNYIISLKGSNPPNAKAPQGNKKG